MRYYILFINTLNGILNDCIANTEIKYGLHSEISFQKGDLLAVYLGGQSKTINAFWRVTQDSNESNVYIKKIIEVSEGVDISTMNLSISIDDESFSNTEVKQIEKKDFESIEQELYRTVLNQKHQDESIFKENLNLNGVTNSGNYIKNPKQIIYYGVPGSGKSNRIEQEVSQNITQSLQIDRIVFHPDYSNADFVGQIMPRRIGNDITYEFKEGPFTSMLKKAYNQTSLPFYLIIEEINRGNASAIFGDIFQLLDRTEEGWSKYEITNEEICKRVFGEHLASEMSFKIKLPPNLSILATMNTSDQNVFTLDNAFQRRWDMVHVKNEFQDNDKESDKQKKSKINGTNMTWGKFLFGDDSSRGINTIIARSSNISGMSSLEDKRLGCWFVVNKGGEISAEEFSNKVLKYLWDDAFHFDKTVFSQEITTFDELVEAFESKQQLFVDLEIPYEIDESI